MSQTTPPRGALSATVADVAPALGAQAAGAERLARPSVAPTRPPALLRMEHRVGSNADPRQCSRERTVGVGRRTGYAARSEQAPVLPLRIVRNDRPHA